MNNKKDTWIKYPAFILKIIADKYDYALPTLLYELASNTLPELIKDDLDDLTNMSNPNLGNEE